MFAALHPEGFYTLEWVKSSIDPEALRAEFVVYDFGLAHRVGPKERTAEDYEQGEEVVAEDNRGERRGYDDDAERPEPVLTALALFIFRRAPLESIFLTGSLCHSLIISDFLLQSRPV